MSETYAFFIKSSLLFELAENEVNENAKKLIVIIIVEKVKFRIFLKFKFLQN